VNVSDEGRIILPEVQEYYEDSLHIFDIVAEIRILLMKRRQRSKPWPGDDDAETQPSGGVNPLVDASPVDHAHADAYADPAQYKRLVEERNAKNGMKQENDITKGWTISRLPQDERGPLELPVATPRHYLCPISRKLMTRPVRSPTTGLCYEQAALRQFIQANPDKAECPVTYKRFTADDMNAPADPDMAKRIADFKANNG
jgi:hypothetical protein